MMKSASLTILVTIHMIGTAWAAEPTSRAAATMPATGSAAQPGQVAPDFTLKTLDGKSEVTLSSFKDRRPVVLVFGSYT
jgi:ferric-dicitrate binding protein FerR (iron transport regulator)